MPMVWASVEGTTMIDYEMLTAVVIGASLGVAILALAWLKWKEPR